MLFYKLYIGFYDVQFFDCFTVSAERRRIYLQVQEKEIQQYIHRKDSMVNEYFSQRIESKTHRLWKSF